MVGGVAAGEQLKQIERGVDILIGTPGRIDDFISTGKVINCGFEISPSPTHSIFFVCEGGCLNLPECV